MSVLSEAEAVWFVFALVVAIFGLWIGFQTLFALEKIQEALEKKVEKQ